MNSRIAENPWFRKALVTVSFLLVSTLLFTKIFTSDYGIHLSTGRYIVENMEIPHTEFLTHPMQGQPQSYEETGFQVILYVVYKTFGSLGVSFFIWSLATLSFLFLYKALRARDVRPYVILLTLLLFAFPFRIRLQPRPESMIYLFSSFLIYGLSLFYYKGNRKILYSFPFLFLLWANIHPSTLMGLGIIGAYGTQSLVIVAREKFQKEAMRRYLYIPLLVLGLCVAGSMISRHGAGSITTPLTIMANIQVMQNTSELVSIRNSSFYLPYKLVVGMTILFAVLGGLAFRLKLHDVITGVYSMRLPLQVARGMAFMSLLTVPLFASAVDGALNKLEEMVRRRAGKSAPIPAARGGGSRAERRGKKRKDIEGSKGTRAVSLPLANVQDAEKRGRAAVVFASAIFVLMIGVGSYYLYYHTHDVVESGIGITEHKFSFKSTEFLRNLDIKGNMFNFFDLGGFLEWQLYPQKLTFIDGRGSAWPSFYDHQLITSATGNMEGIFSKYRITYVVTKAADSSGIVLPLIGYLANSKDWELVFSDGLTVVFMKNVPENRRIVERYKLPKQFLTYHIITELVHYTYLGVSKQYVYATVSGIYRSLGELDKANKFTEHFQAASRTPWIVRMLDGALS